MTVDEGRQILENPRPQHARGDDHFVINIYKGLTTRFYMASERPSHPRQHVQLRLQTNSLLGRWSLYPVRRMAVGNSRHEE